MFYQQKYQSSWFPNHPTVFPKLDQEPTSYLNCYQLDQAQPHSYPNGSPASLLLQTVAQQLVAHFGLPHVFAHLNECLNCLYQELAPLPDYAISNLIQILRHLGVDDDALDQVSSDAAVGSLAHQHFVDNY